MKRNSNDGREKSAKLRLIMAMFIFGTLGVFVRNILLPSSVVAFFRGVIGTLFLIGFVKMRKIKISYREMRNNLLVLSLSGMLIGINWILLFEAYRYTTVAIATLCYYLAPVFVMLASPFILKEKLTVKKVVCIVIALIGMVFVSGIFQKGETENLQIKGIMFGVGAAAIYASIVLLNKRLKRISSYSMTIIQLGIAAIVIIPYILMTQNIGSLTFDFSTIILLGIVGILNTGIAYVLYFSVFQELKAHTIAIFSYIDPIVAILVSALILKEIPDVFTIVGGGLILGSTLASEL